MIDARQIKTWLKGQDIDAKHARSISGKRNGKKVVHFIEVRSGSILKPIFPVEMRERMLKIVYGEQNFESSNWIGGNVEPHMVALRPTEWVKLMEVME